MNDSGLIRETKHTINGTEYVFQEITATISDPDTMLIHMKEGIGHRLIFKGDYKAYEMFCVIANEYRGF